jgi:hypothetical protein
MKAIRNHFIRISITSIGFFLGTIILISCTSNKTQLSLYRYQFKLNNKIYRIHSISSKDKNESHNKLFCEYFLAVDLDQDQIIDRIILGNVSLQQAQKVYEHGLYLLAIENKLRLKIPDVNRFVHENSDFLYEIKSFQTNKNHFFNEFKIIDKRQIIPDILLTIDNQADGTLDEVLKGTTSLSAVQSIYTDIIRKGLHKQKMTELDNVIVVKERKTINYRNNIHN